MPPRERRQAGAQAQGGDGDGEGPQPQRAAAAPAGLFDVLEVAVLVGLLERKSKRALRLASREACAAVERMATRMELAAGEAPPDTVALQRLVRKLPNVHRPTCCSDKEEGIAGFMEAAGLMGAFATSRLDAAAGVRTMHLDLMSSQTLRTELPLVLASFCNLQARCPISWARPRLRLVGPSFNPHMLPSNLAASAAQRPPAAA
jgi:hypothetical protein